MKGERTRRLDIGGVRSRVGLIASLEIACHGAVQKLGHRDVVIISVVLQVELNHQRLLVLINGNVVLLS